MSKRTPSANRNVVPIVEAVERRQRKLARKSLHDLADAAADLGDDLDAGHLVMVGNLALLEGAFEEAIAAFSRALALAPGAPDVLNARAGRARARAGLGDHALALADYDHAAKLEPLQARHHVGRANVLAKLGRMEEAVAATSRAIEVAPGDAGAHYTRAVYRSHLDDSDPGVRADLDRTVELAPHEALYLEKRADYLFESEEYDAALADADRALALAPDNARLHLLRGKCLNGPVVYDDDDDDRLRCEAALASLERAMELAPREGSLRGDILWAMMGTRESMRDEEAFLALLERALVELPEDQAVLLALRKDRRRRLGKADGADADG
jgi:tetratricopeptide (TPR) repeat protein